MATLCLNDVLEFNISLELRINVRVTLYAVFGRTSASTVTYAPSTGAQHVSGVVTAPDHHMDFCHASCPLLDLHFPVPCCSMLHLGTVVTGRSLVYCA